MSDFLPQYTKVDPTTWAYLSSLLMIALFFKFNRIWSVRNFDIILLILLAPGLLLIQKGRQILLNHPPLPSADVSALNHPASLPPVRESNDEGATPELSAVGDPPPVVPMPPESISDRKLEPSPELRRAGSYVQYGFLWLLGISLVWLVRLLLDPTMVRRPLLEPNLSLGGMTFLCAFLFLFLMANVIRGKAESLELELEGSRGAQVILTLGDAVRNENDYKRHGPGYYLVHVLPRVATSPFTRPSQAVDSTDIITAKAMSISAHLALIVGMIIVGYRHFDNIRMGIGAATLYLMLPYTAQMTGHVDHILPASLLLWAIVAYRHPLYSGMLIGLGMGTSYFALYLLPLWISFYWQRGFFRFLLGTFVSLAVLTGILAFASDDFTSFSQKFQAMFGLWPMAMKDLGGIWDTRLDSGWESWYRVPILTVFVVLCGGFAVWPAQKNLGTLLSCSAAVMTASQFWHGQGGGLYMAWYLPLALLTVFRPNLEDRIALSVLGEGWFPRNRTKLGVVDRAA